MSDLDDEIFNLETEIALLNRVSGNSKVEFKRLAKQLTDLSAGLDKSVETLANLKVAKIVLASEFQNIVNLRDSFKLELKSTAAKITQCQEAIEANENKLLSAHKELNKLNSLLQEESNNILEFPSDTSKSEESN